METFGGTERGGGDRSLAELRPFDRQRYGVWVYYPPRLLPSSAGGGGGLFLREGGLLLLAHDIGVALLSGSEALAVRALALVVGGVLLEVLLAREVTLVAAGHFNCPLLLVICCLVCLRLKMERKSAVCGFFVELKEGKGSMLDFQKKKIFGSCNNLGESEE